MSAVLTEIISLLVGGITGIASGIGTGLQELVKDMFLTGSGTQESPYALSVFGGVIAIFGGIALAVGLSRLVFNWIISLGATK